MDLYHEDDYPPLAPHFPAFAEWERKRQEWLTRYRSLQLDHWPADQPRLKARFGTEGVELSIAQAKRAKLVKQHGMYLDVVYRIHDGDLAAEDHLLMPFLKKERAAKERAKARKHL